MLKIQRGPAIFARTGLLLCLSLLTITSPAEGNENTALRRIVTLGGAVTEIVYELGQEGLIVAVDSTSQYPAAATRKPNVGYLRSLGAEPILALNPELILAAADAGPPTVLQQLSDAGVKIVSMPEEPTLENIHQKVSIIASALRVPERGKKLQDRLRNEFASLTALSQATPPPRVLFLLAVGSGSPRAGGRDTSANTIITLAGGRNAVENFSGYKSLSPEAAINSAPDVILLTDRSLQTLGGTASLLQTPWIASTPAAESRRIISMDGLLLLGFGPRTASAVRQLADLLQSSPSP